MARLICSLVPSVQKVRMCNSGTEACMSAIRLARGFTKRDKIIKFDGCYHGHADSLLVKAGSGALTFGHPDSAGVPAAFTQHTIVLPFNDAEAVKAAFAANKNQIAGIIVEPVPGNAGVYLPKAGLSGIPARNHESERRVADFRRGDDRLSSRARRRAGTIRHHAGFDVSRQNHRRRFAGGRVRRAGGHHGLARAAGAGLSSWHVERQSAGDGGGHCGAGGTCTCRMRNAEFETGLKSHEFRQDSALRSLYTA